MRLALLLPVLVMVAGLTAGQEPPARKPAEPLAPPSLVLLTLDTTRADVLGAWGGEASTPHLDALAAAGTRWSGALTPAPLTLPAHTSLLTGLEPPEHGVRDNGTSVLGPGVPTLATVLAARGWATGAFIASRVLDRRFGLDRGFEVYDDHMAAERVGEYGYPERDAAAVTDAALAWLAEVPEGRPYFLWAHYYDPHAPYQPPPGFGGTGERGAYAGEVAYMDREIGRLLTAVRRRSGRPWIAAVGDHGEALGEHGERAHGIFLYRASLEVPLIVAGPGVGAGRVVAEAVSIRRLAPTLLALLGEGGEALPGAGPPLPGLGPEAEPRPKVNSEPPPEPVYSEARLGATAYGWSPLVALSDGRWRLIVAPRPELYDVTADPAESRNLLTEKREEARRLKTALEARREAMRERRAPAVKPDPELTAALESLGYLSGSNRVPAPGQGLDPKDGILLLADFERGKALLGAGRAAEASRLFEALVAKNPGNVPFLSRLAGARLAAGDGEAALAAYRKAVGLNPRSEFLHLQLADAYAQLGRREEARRELELVLEIDPRSAAAWLRLAEAALRSGDAAGERRLLAQAVMAGADSAGILTRLGQVELAAGEAALAAGHLAAAVELTPRWATPWLLLGQARLAAGDRAAARGALERAAALAPGAPEGRQARRLLEEMGTPR